jgi:hypothetical protein
MKITAFILVALSMLPTLSQAGDTPVECQAVHIFVQDPQNPQNTIDIEIGFKNAAILSDLEQGVTLIAIADQATNVYWREISGHDFTIEAVGHIEDIRINPYMIQSVYGVKMKMDQTIVTALKLKTPYVYTVCSAFVE